MNFNNHSNLEGEHAFLSPSKYHWINYDEEKLATVFSAFQASQRGTELHELASNCIRLGVKLPKSKNALNSFVNDAIGFKMQTEQVLYFSDNCFGTADAISFRKNFLRIHDLKNGITPTSVNQLLVYAALFCLEYGFIPSSIGMELRIYQSDNITVYVPDPEEVAAIMNKIIAFNKKIERIKEGGYLS